MDALNNLVHTYMYVPMLTFASYNLLYYKYMICSFFIDDYWLFIKYISRFLSLTQFFEYNSSRELNLTYVSTRSSSCNKLQKQSRNTKNSIDPGGFGSLLLNLKLGSFGLFWKLKLTSRDLHFRSFPCLVGKLTEKSCSEILSLLSERTRSYMYSPGKK